jgi:hypothetical protein
MALDTIKPETESPMQLGDPPIGVQGGPTLGHSEDPLTSILDQRLTPLHERIVGLFGFGITDFGLAGVAPPATGCK